MKWLPFLRAVGVMHGELGQSLKAVLDCRTISIPGVRSGVLSC